MGGYGGASGRTKEKCYYDTGGHKVKDKNAIAVAEEYIKEGKYVAFLQEIPGRNRADLSVEGVHTEVKGLSTLNADNVEGRLQHAFKQIHGDDDRYPADTHREGKVIILSTHDKSVSKSKIIEVMKKGYQQAYNKGYVTGKLEVWIRGERILLN